jgi:hypothetical protein
MTKRNKEEIAKEVQILTQALEKAKKEQAQNEIPVIDIPAELKKDPIHTQNPHLKSEIDVSKYPDFVEIPNFHIPIVEDGKVKVAKKHSGLKFWQKVKLNRNPLTTYLVTMIYGNATVEHFVLETSSNFFTHGKKLKYHLNKTKCLWDSNEKQNRLYYHVDCVEPLEFQEIHKITGLNEAYASITPQNLEPIIKMEFVRLIAEGPELSRMVKICLFLLIAVLGLLIIIVIIFIAQSGIFQQMASGLKGVAGGAV